MELTLDPALRTASANSGRAAGRDVYRIVQEGLTNARKHAPGEPVRISVTAAADHVDVLVVNRCAPASLGVPGTQSGLIGLRERTTVAGGALDHGRTRHGEFELKARLPWP